MPPPSVLNPSVLSFFSPPRFVLFTVGLLPLWSGGPGALPGGISRERSKVPHRPSARMDVVFLNLIQNILLPFVCLRQPGYFCSSLPHASSLGPSTGISIGFPGALIFAVMKACILAMCSSVIWAKRSCVFRYSLTGLYVLGTC